MKTPILFFFLLLIQLSPAQNQDLKQQAILFFNEGNVQEALQTLEQIKDEQTLAETDINIWKKHCKEILDYKFQDGAVINDSVKIVVVKTSLVTHFGLYNSNTKKYIIAPVYDEIPLRERNSNYIVANLNRQKTLLDLSGKTIIAFGNYIISPAKCIILTSNDENAKISLYNYKGKLLVNDLKYAQQINQDYFLTQKNSNKFGLFDAEKAQFLIDDCDKIQDIDKYFNVNINGFFIKKDNKTEVRNFNTNRIIAQNAFDEIVIFDKGSDIFQQNQIKTDKDKLIIVKKNSKFGIYNLTKDKYDTEPVYDSINNFYNCLKNKVWKNLKYEYPIKEEFDYFSNTVAVVYTKNNLFGLKTIANKTITEAQFDEIEQINTTLFFTKKQKLWGWISVAKDKISIVKPQFDHVYVKYDFIRSGYPGNYKDSTETYLETCFKSKIKKFTLEGKEYGNSESKTEKGLSKKEYPYTDWSYAVPNLDRILSSQTKFADEEEPQDQKLFGLDDKMGNEIVKPIYTQILSGLENQFLVVNTDRDAGVIDKNGKVIIPAQYNSVATFDNKYYLVGESYYFGLFDKDGKELFPATYKEIKVFLDGFYFVKDQDNLCRIVDVQRKKDIYVFPKFTEYVYGFEKITTLKGEEFYNLKFRSKRGYEYSDDHFLIKIENNRSSRILEKYNIRQIYNNRIIELESNKLIGFYDLNNQKLIEPKFKEIQIVYDPKNLIYAKTDKYFETIIDENLYEKVSKDQISSITNNVIFYEKNGKYGFFDKNGQKTKNTFQNVDVNYPIYSAEGKLYKFYENDKRPGLVSDKGKIIIKSNIYDVIYEASKRITLYGKKSKKEELEQILICIDKSDKAADKIDFVSSNGNKVASIMLPKKDYAIDFRKGIAIIKASDEAIFLSLDENKVIQKVNGNLFFDDDSGFTVMKNNNSTSDAKVLVQKYSTKGNLIAERLIDRNRDIRYLDNWRIYLIQKKENKYGITKVDEKIFIPFVYDTIIPSVDSVYIAKKNSKYGMIDRNNNVLLSFEYDKIETQYLLERIINSNDVEIIKEMNDKRMPQKPSFNFIVSKDHKMGILGPNLESILPIEFDGFRKDRTLYNPIIARKDNKTMVYSNQGSFLFQVQCDSLVDTKYNAPRIYKIYENGKQGFLDEKGKLIFPLRYSKVEKTFANNLFIIEKDSKKYIVNAAGEIISPAYDEINFSKFQGNLEVKSNNKFGLVNKSGTLIIPVIYDSLVQILDYRYVVVSLNGMHGIIDLQADENKMLPVKIPVSYGNILQIVKNKYLIVSDPFKVGVIDLNNKIVIPMIYDSVYYQDSKNYFVCSNTNEEIRFITADNVVIKDENN
ncbi:WG repeat-containing protein [Flavobacterium sp. LC2016-01]|uniref:WG repeat-containing protein n=1 Tax=Flavobacterium sp. LC2016-01 TaxID=2675876 RepID=UPI0012BA6D54|nr:WG repeat-containing protein [Flavobacterium sp. LC2016-01]MTH16578.1 hypothetical protein [Flavobacterium sp. LC2016-01]